MMLRFYYFFFGLLLVQGCPCLGALLALCSLLVFTVHIVVPCWHFIFMFPIVLDFTVVSQNKFDWIMTNYILTMVSVTAS